MVGPLSNGLAPDDLLPRVSFQDRGDRSDLSLRQVQPAHDGSHNNQCRTRLARNYIPGIMIPSSGANAARPTCTRPMPPLFNGLKRHSCPAREAFDSFTSSSLRPSTHRRRQHGFPRRGTGQHDDGSSSSSAGLFEPDPVSSMVLINDTADTTRRAYRIAWPVG